MCPPVIIFHISNFPAPSLCSLLLFPSLLPYTITFAAIFTSYNPPFCSLLFNFLSIPFFQLFLSSPLYSSPIHTLSSLLTPLEMDKCYLHKHNLINLTLNKSCIVMVDIFSLHNGPASIYYSFLTFHQKLVGS